MPGIVKEIYSKNRMSKDLSRAEIVKRIKKGRKEGKPVVFAFGSDEPIIRKAICNGTV
jgi:hypothetical protein